MNILEKIFDSIAFIIAYSITALLFKSAKFLYLSLTLPMRAGIIQKILGDIFKFLPKLNYFLNFLKLLQVLLKLLKIVQYLGNLDN